MIWGENLTAEEAIIQCKCGRFPATVEVLDKHKTSCGWYCRDCARGKRLELQKIETIAHAILVKGRP